MPVEVVSVRPTDDLSCYSEAVGWSFCSLFVFSPGIPTNDCWGLRLTLICIGFFETACKELLNAVSFCTPGVWTSPAVTKDWLLCYRLFTTEPRLCWYSAGETSLAADTIAAGATFVVFIVICWSGSGAAGDATSAAACYYYCYWLLLFLLALDK